MNFLDPISNEASSFQPETMREMQGPQFLSESQAVALTHLAALSALQGQPPRGGVTPRTKALIVGPSGVGKTALIRRLSDLEKLPLLVINATHWIINGAATKPSTLAVIQKFVVANERGILALDEIEKAVPHGRRAYDQVWSLGIFGELISILDAETSLKSAGWETTQIERLKSSFLIVGSGAWQFIQSEEKRGSMKSYAEGIASDAGIPEEILFRFNAKLLVIDFPSRKDFATSFGRLRKDLGLPKLESAEEQKLVSQAVRSRHGMRFVEHYLTDLLILHPELLKKVSLVKIESPSSSKISKAEYKSGLITAYEVLEAAQNPILKLIAQVHLCQLLTKAASPGEKQDPLPSQEMAALIKDLTLFSECLYFGTCLDVNNRRGKVEIMMRSGASLAHRLGDALEHCTYGLKSSGLLDLVIQAQVHVKRVNANWTELGGMEIDETD